MNIVELDSYNLADAVKFHNRLNPRLWGDDEHLRSDVRDKLLEIAEDFREFLGIDNLQIKDITVSGSNAAFNYTPHSDIDLHLVADLPDADNSDVFRELFDAKKFQYNKTHDIRIGGYDVELYVQNPNDEHHSQGIYSLLQNKWLSVPKRRKPEINDISVKSKYEDVGHRIEDAVRSGSLEQMNDTWQKLKAMRKQGLEREGEFSPENLAFKILRNNGTIQKLVDARQAVKDRELSLAEAAKPRERFRYGFATESPDGVNPTTKQILETTTDDVVMTFIKDTAQRLGIKRMPKIHLHDDTDWSHREKSFGMFVPEKWELHVNMANRHLFDILRTTAHELAHVRQHEIEELGPDAGETGSDMENEAHAVAGIIMRDFADAHPDWFADQPVIESASGYIPTKKQAKDPRFSHALTVDIKPGQVGKEANKLNLQTDAQGHPELLIKNLRNQLREFKELDKPELTVGQLAKKHKVSVDAIKQQLSKGIKVELEHTSNKKVAREIALDHLAELPDYYDRLESAEKLNEDELMEIRMSTANLRQEAAKTGAMAGMEFEMIVPDAEGEPPEPEYERDEDYDRRARSFDDIEEFFYDGDYNGRGDIRRLQEALDEAYQEWKMDQVSDDWIRDGLDYIREYIERYDLFDREEALDTARDEIITANPDLPTDSEDFQQLINARINELKEEFIQNEFDAQGNIYNDAFTEFADDKNDDYSEQDFLRDNYPYMSDIERDFDIQWPYYYDINAGAEGTTSVDEVADEFEEAIGRPVNASSSYHGATRQAGKYVVEPDGSLEGDNPGDAGLEFVSPPLPIDELLSDLNKVKEWAGSRGCYTNDSTGLHINISVPNYSLEKLDYVKLALLMGDEYVLDLFGRSGNHYAKAATGKIRDALKRNPDLAPQLMDKMRGHLEDLATKAIHSGTTDKYTSINTKSGYIEFRSPGGDWLDANFAKVENTLLRFTVALSAAIDPEAYRQEYLKKLYKLLEGSQDKGGVDVVQLFSNYSAGELDKAALIRQVREKQLARNLAKGKTPPGQKYWWSVTNPANTFASIEVVATSKEEAIEKAVEPGNYPEWARVQNTLQAKPLRPYQEPQAPNQTGNWGIWMQGPGRFARAPGQIDNSVLRRFPSREAAEQWIAQTRSTNSAMRTDIEVREIPIAGSTMDRAMQRAQAAQPAGEQGSYELYRISDGRTVTAPAGNPIIFRALNPDDAESKIARYAADFNLGAPELFAVRSVLDVPSAQQPEFVDTTTQSNRGDLTPHGPGPWEIYRLSDNQAVRSLEHTSRPAAESEARSALGLRGLDPTEYGVRTRQQAAAANYRGPWEIVRMEDGRVMGTIASGNHAEAEVDMERRVRNAGLDAEHYDIRPAQPAAAQAGDIVAPGLGEPATPRTLTTPGQPQQTFTGQWDVVLGGEVVFRVPGENQSIANQAARQWILGRSPEFLRAHQGQEVEVVPRYA